VSTIIENEIYMTVGHIGCWLATFSTLSYR